MPAVGGLRYRGWSPAAGRYGLGGLGQGWCFLVAKSIRPLSWVGFLPLSEHQEATGWRRSLRSLSRTTLLIGVGSGLPEECVRVSAGVRFGCSRCQV